MLKLEQNYHNTRKSVRFAMWMVSESHSRADAISPLSISLSVCLCMCVCVYTRVSVHACMPAYSALCLETTPVKACFR